MAVQAQLPEATRLPSMLRGARHQQPQGEPPQRPRPRRPGSSDGSTALSTNRPVGRSIRFRRGGLLSSNRCIALEAGALECIVLEIIVSRGICLEHVDLECIVSRDVALLRCLINSRLNSLVTAFGARSCNCWLSYLTSIY